MDRGLGTFREHPNVASCALGLRRSDVQVNVLPSKSEVGEAAADAAVVGLARTAGADELFEIFCRYGMRDFRDLGHKNPDADAICSAIAYAAFKELRGEHGYVGKLRFEKQLEVAPDVAAAARDAERLGHDRLRGHARI